MIQARGTARTAGSRIEQAVILCGGLGTRLGALTEQTPKPLLNVGGRPFLERLIFEVRRFGIKRFLLLAAFRAEAIDVFAAGVARSLDITIDIAFEGEPCGTGGALWKARDRLDDRFFLLNGDSWFDVNLLDLSVLAGASGSVAALALRRLEETGRYGTVVLEGERVACFMEPTFSPEPGLVNGGVYAVRKEIVDALTPNCSLERDALTPLAAAGQLAGRSYDRFFLDIGIPKDFTKAQVAVPAAQTRAAVFLDRDGVLNKDLGYVGHVERFVWLPGARAAVKSLNDLGHFVFLVTNQAGVARGFFGEADVAILHTYVQNELAVVGAHLDDIRYCPFHPDGTVARYAVSSSQRKPAPGMILDLLELWPVDRQRSVMIGDREHDAAAGRNAGLKGYCLKDGESLQMALTHLLPVLNATPSANGPRNDIDP